MTHLKDVVLGVVIVLTRLMVSAQRYSVFIMMTWSMTQEKDQRIVTMTGTNNETSYQTIDQLTKRLEIVSRNALRKEKP